MSNQYRETGNEEKVAYFQEVTGVEDSYLSAQILDAHGWNLDAAVSAMTGVASSSVRGEQEIVARGREEESTSERDRSRISGSFEAGRMQFYRQPSSSGDQRHYEYGGTGIGHFLQLRQGPGLIWRLVAIPFWMIRGSYNLMYGAVGLGMWVAGGMLAYGLGALGLIRSDDGRDTRALLSPPTGALEASYFVREFESEYGDLHLAFQNLSFMEALRRAGQEFKFLFVYLHSPDHGNTSHFCETSLCSESVVQFINENFVVWGGDVRATEGFQMSRSLKASTFPFCAVVTATSNQRIALLQQIEGPRSASDFLAILQRVVEEQGPVLVAMRVEQEEQLLNRRLREEQDAAYQAALHADQETDRQKQEAAQQAALKAEEAERKRKNEEEMSARAAQEAADRELALEKRRREKATSLGSEPQKGPDVTQVLVRLPNGERKERRFASSTAVQKVYDFVDSLGFFDSVNYRLVSNFPWTVYGPEKLGLSLRDAGLHPQASLFVQVEDN